MGILSLIVITLATVTYSNSQASENPASTEWQYDIGGDTVEVVSAEVQVHVVPEEANETESAEWYMADLREEGVPLQWEVDTGLRSRVVITQEGKDGGEHWRYEYEGGNITADTVPLWKSDTTVPKYKPKHC